jgi:arylsulfatase A-like enzyme
MKRRDLLKSMAAAAGMTLAGCGSTSSQTFPSSGTSSAGSPRRPNVLLMIVDELRLPPVGYGPLEGEIPQLKELLGFGPTLSASNGLANYYRGFARLRENAVVMRTHYIAAAACAPSRTSFITGTYPSVHGVTQTDGMFKGLTEVSWLDPNGVPTLGDWMRAGGYTTHWFGKWHHSNTETGYDGCDDPNNPHFEPWGFGDGEGSCPEPHGGGVNGPAGGLYRDPGFADLAVDFLQSKGQQKTDGVDSAPWLAVCSLVNPHDIGYYPNFWYLPNAGAQDPKVPPQVPAPIPAQGDISLPDPNGFQVDLNPDGLPQSLFGVPSSSSEDLHSKPDCHLEYAYKVAYALNSGVPVAVQDLLARPYQTQANPEAWYKANGDFYCYLTYLVNLEMERVLQALDNSGLRDDTIVIFVSDHGNMGGAHGGMAQKWHTAYEEVVRTPMVISSPLVNPDRLTMREVLEPSSLIDLVPTVLGLTGFTPEQLRPYLSGHRPVELVGADLSGHILGTASGPVLDGTGEPRPGVLFTTDDLITELPEAGLAESPPLNAARYQTYLGIVQQAIEDGIPLSPGPVVQPNVVRCLVNREWKLVRYVDPNGVHPDQWELYHLLTDPTEVRNLVDYRTGALRPELSIPGLTPQQLEAQRQTLLRQLQAQEARLLQPAAV